MSKMGSHCSFRIWNTSYGQKKGRESNSRESPSFDSRPLKVGNWPLPDVRFGKCDTASESSQWELQLCFRPHCNRRSARKVMGLQSPGSPIGAISGLPRGSPGKNSHLDVASVESCRIYYKGEVVGFPQGGRCWLPHQREWGGGLLPSPECVCVQSESEFTRGLSQHQKDSTWVPRGKVVASPKSGPWWVLCVRVARDSS